MTAAEVREAMGPEMCAFADAMRDRFGAKLCWVRTDSVELGSEPDRGVPTQWDGKCRESTA
jgi:hypothetical protein